MTKASKETLIVRDIVGKHALRVYKRKSCIIVVLKNQFFGKQLIGTAYNGIWSNRETKKQFRRLQSKLVKALSTLELATTYTFGFYMWYYPNGPIRTNSRAQTGHPTLEIFYQ